MSDKSHPKLLKLTEKDGETVEKIVKKALPHFGGMKEKATIQLRVLPVGNAHGKAVYSIGLTPSGAFLHKHNAIKPTLVVIMTSEAFHGMAEGSYSPVQAYHDGKLELHGNVDLARNIVTHLSRSGE
jgi:putative sterol carrier protein